MNSIRHGMHSLRREINLNNGNAVTGCTVLEIRWATASNHGKSPRNLVLFTKWEYTYSSVCLPRFSTSRIVKMCLSPSKAAPHLRAPNKECRAVTAS